MFPISIAAEIYFAEGAETLARNLIEVRPTMMTAVPRLYETMYQRIRLAVERERGLKRRLFERAVAIGRKRLAGEPLSLGDQLIDPVLDNLVRDKVGARFGGRLKALISGGAPRHPEIGGFFVALGVQLLQGYGQTEAAPVICCNPPEHIKIDTVGPPLDGVDVRIAEDGEILVAGDNVMKGYWNDPEAALARDRSTKTKGAAGEELSSRAHRFERLDIGPVVVRDPEIVVTDLRVRDADIILGMDFLSSRRLWLSYASFRVFLSDR
jgi:long-chain acyl-CoA synthetase